MTFKPAPGIVVLEHIEDSSSLAITSKQQTQIGYGRVIAIGKDLTTPLGKVIQGKDYCKIGDLVYFLTYEGGYDHTTINGKKYYFVKFDDLRTTIL